VKVSKSLDLRLVWRRKRQESKPIRVWSSYSSSGMHLILENVNWKNILNSKESISMMCKQKLNKLLTDKFIQIFQCQVRVLTENPSLIHWNLLEIRGDKCFISYFKKLIKLYPYKKMHNIQNDQNNTNTLNPTPINLINTLTKLDTFNKNLNLFMA
jgi:hypothetical protein